MSDPVETWASALASWAIPPEILGGANAAPWLADRSVFVRRATERQRAPRGISYQRAREALPDRGSVLDVGCGAGAASLPLLGRATSLIAVDPDAVLLRSLVDHAAGDAGKVRVVEGTWPASAAGLSHVDVAVCHHVLYNVPDLAPFIGALAATARRRVVIEITAAHPVARLNPLWLRFHDLVRPERPTWEDAFAAISSLQPPSVAGVQAELERLDPDRAGGTWADLVATTTRRLCLGPERQAEVGAALTELLGALPDDPATWSAPTREVATIWWDPASSG